MQVKVITADPLKFVTPALVVGCFEDVDGTDLLERLDRGLNGVLSFLRQQKEFSGELNKVKELNTLGQMPAERVVLVGLGKRRELTAERVRQSAGTASRTLNQLGVSSCLATLPQIEGGDRFAGAVVEGMMLGSYRFDVYRTEPKERACLAELNLAAETKREAKAMALASSESRIICDAVRMARDLVSHPGNHATPAFLAEQALAIAARQGFACHVLDAKEIENLGMNGLLFVGKGSAQPPRFIIMEYHGRRQDGKPVVIVGKGITFDSGGISLKPREGMERMKDDMSGAAAVFGVMKAAAALKIPVNLVGLVPAAENMPDGGAYKPGDVVRTMSGKTVEINNTDAEGRMVLCDALHYAQRYRPSALIDLATLTGACLVALGTEASGLMGNDDGLKRALKKAGEATGERVWELPLWDEYGEAMKSDIADLKNAGGPHAGTVTAAWFLRQFVGKAKWAHLDIAGTAWEEKGRNYLPKGATGVGVRLLVDYLRGIAG
ncbi:putative cytosol aminopeptidase [Geobacter sp. OR-1]|uniref:leucyl aminopeptidase n=1 Tax=Geobacter sp. OR-1 TaxID=1266765 RepID=UPI0005436C34|nr:leucyl aminopeptidase [Geobacter sp. OR-1]GAM11220.1 putative cytosol aminopeptidase [Geobacter sp. OR-1]